MENSLLTHSDIEQLIASKSKAEYNSLISAKGSGRLGYATRICSE